MRKQVWEMIAIVRKPGTKTQTEDRHCTLKASYELNDAENLLSNTHSPIKCIRIQTSASLVIILKSSVRWILLSKCRPNNQQSYGAKSNA